MGETLLQLLKSKKGQAMLAGVAAYALARAGFDVPAEELMLPLGLVGMYIGSQGLADFKKEAAKHGQTLIAGDPVEFEAARVREGLADTGGGSRLGKEARAEYDATGGNEWERQFHADQKRRAQQRRTRRK
jgi:hypothetical protein